MYTHDILKCKIKNTITNIGFFNVGGSLYVKNDENLSTNAEMNNYEEGL